MQELVRHGSAKLTLRKLTTALRSLTSSRPSALRSVARPCIQGSAAETNGVSSSRPRVAELKIL